MEHTNDTQHLAEARGVLCFGPLCTSACRFAGQSLGKELLLGQALQCQLLVVKGLLSSLSVAT